MAATGRTVCVSCKAFFKPLRNGVYIEEGMPLERGGLIEWQPYKLFVADLLVCPGCGNQIITGIGQGPIAEHYQRGYADAIKRYPPLLRIEDC